jgi:hypothetical protein
VKRGTQSNSKFRALSRRLGNARDYTVSGILVNLWALAARETPRGDIGRLPNTRIADGIDWDGDPHELVAALVETGWVDEHPTHRLVIHDWHEHAEDSVKKLLVRRKLTFADLDPKCPDISRLPVPVPEPEPEETDRLIDAPESETLTVQDEALPEQDEIRNAPPGDEQAARSSQGAGVTLNQTVSQDDATLLPFVDDDTPDPDPPPNLPLLDDGTRHMTREEAAAVQEVMRRLVKAEKRRSLIETASELYLARRLFTDGCPVGVFKQVTNDYTNAEGKLTVANFSYFEKCVRTRLEQIATRGSHENHGRDEGAGQGRGRGYSGPRAGRGAPVSRSPAGAADPHGLRERTRRAAEAVDWDALAGTAPGDAG